MSRSRRKTPIFGVAKCSSEKQDKQIWHQRWRARERSALAGASAQALETHMPLLKNQVSNVWAMGKDGRTYWPLGAQIPEADRLAEGKGRNAQERASLKIRLLRKWMSK